MCTVALSLGCVMAGSGDLDSLRLLRELRWKVDDVIYGSHLSLSMSIGLLFLAGGTYSLRRDPISTASLLLSICPRYPARTLDNQYHLQALRHLYVLATETRALHSIGSGMLPTHPSISFKIVGRCGFWLAGEPRRGGGAARWIHAADSRPRSAAGTLLHPKYSNHEDTEK